MKEWEAQLFTDTRRPWKALATWALLMTLLVYYGVLTSRPERFSALTHLQDATALEGMAVQLAFERLVDDPLRPGHYVLDTVLGWIPLHDPRGLLVQKERVSVAGVFHQDGSVTVERLLRHPERGMKAFVSAVTLAVLTVLTLWQGWRRRATLFLQRPETTAPDPSVASRQRG